MFNHVEVACGLTCPSTRTPTGVHSLRSFRFAGAGYVYVRPHDEDRANATDVNARVFSALVRVRDCVARAKPHTGNLVAWLDRLCVRGSWYFRGSRPVHAHIGSHRSGNCLPRDHHCAGAVRCGLVFCVSSKAWHSLRALRLGPDLPRLRDVSPSKGTEQWAVRSQL